LISEFWNVEIRWPFDVLNGGKTASEAQKLAAFE
jgi:hypothetical protein